MAGTIEMFFPGKGGVWARRITPLELIIIHHVRFVISVG